MVFAAGLCITFQQDCWWSCTLEEVGSGVSLRHEKTEHA